MLSGAVKVWLSTAIEEKGGERLLDRRHASIPETSVCFMEFEEESLGGEKPALSLIFFPTFDPQLYSIKFN